MLAVIACLMLAINQFLHVNDTNFMCKRLCDVCEHSQFCSAAKDDFNVYNVLIVIPKVYVQIKCCPIMKYTFTYFSPELTMHGDMHVLLAWCMVTK